MNKERVYNELKNEWKLFDMSDDDILKVYQTITGCDTKDEDIGGIKEYLLIFALDQMINDGDCDIETAREIIKEVQTRE